MLSPDPVKSNTSLYAKREPVYPKAVDGPYRRFKWAVMILTLGIYYITPWLRWDRGPHAPDQAVLIDLAHRRFFMFGIEIWPHEFYFVAGLLIMAGIGLFLITSAVGRAWCGYACPQTVWTDLFQHVDRFVDGDRNAQMRLDAAPWSANKVFKRGLKWSIYLAISFWTGGAWIMYFADAPTLTVDFWTGQAAPVAYATVGVLTLTTFVLGGFMREQVCVYMCPWPRIQTAMLDEKSLIVTYKDWRGEPRGSIKKAEKNPGAVGDCIDCNGCVNVCPTGYDIRNGPDIKCITCALCIDACDGVMDKLGRERGLISYATLADYNTNMAIATAGNTCAITPALVRTPQGKLTDKLAHFHVRKIFRPRTLVYFGAWSLVGLLLLYALLTRDRLEVNVLHDRNPLYVTLSDGSIRNGYTVKLLNKIPEPRTIIVTLQGLRGAEMNVVGIDQPADRSFAIRVEPDKLTTLKVYVRQPADHIEDKVQPFRFVIEDKSSFETDSYNAQFEAPEEFK